MGLFDFGNQNPGLLGGGSDPKQAALMQAAFQLLAGSQKRGFLENIGTAGLSGLEGYGQAQQQQRQQKMQDFQFGQAQTDAQRRQAEWERTQKLQALPGQFMKPQLPPMDATDPNAQAPAPQFDMPGYLNALKGIDPEAWVRLSSAMAKTGPESMFGKVDPKDYTPESLQRFKATGDHAALVPVRKAEFVNGQAVNPYAIAPGTVLDTNDPNKPFALKGGQPVPNLPFQQYELRRSEAGATKVPVSINTGQRGLDNELKIRGDFRNEPVYKAHQEMQAAYAQIQQSLKQATPAGDLAGATKIMKLLDPGSVVRESELGMAMAATGLLDRAQNYAQNVISGNKLTPKQRVEFQQLADALYSESVKSYNGKRTEYEQLGKGYDMNTDRLLGPAASAPGPARTTTVRKYNPATGKIE